jgi:PPOX class probable F420-dependent enzyme
MPEDVIPDSHRDLLDAEGFAHLASIGPDGEPQSHPVWYDFQDGQVWVSTTKSRQKHRNVQRDPRVALSILDPKNPYRYLEVRGRVTVEDDPDKKLIDFLAQKYLGADEYPHKSPSEERVVLRIEPEHAASQG